jgi:hypothetical protein
MHSILSQVLFHNLRAFRPCGGYTNCFEIAYPTGNLIRFSVFFAFWSSRSSSRMSWVPCTSLCLLATYVKHAPTRNIDFVLMISKSTGPLNLLHVKVIGSAVPCNNPLKCLFIYICYRYMFRPLLAIFRRNIQLLLEVIAPTTDPLFCVL